MYYHRSVSMTPAPIEGEIVLKNHHEYRFGVHTDINGKRWHFNGFMNGVVLAAPYDTMDEYWKSTTTASGYGYHSQTWLPYKVKILK